mgnify:CR=1 FL=1
MIWILLVCSFLLSLFIAFLFILNKKNLNIWIVSYIKQLFRKEEKAEGPVHLMFCFVDHFEPQWNSPKSIDIERVRVDRWLNDYPLVAGKHKDADGNYPQHTFFYPIEEYRKEHLDKIQSLCEMGYGEIEVHLHHHDDTPENLRQTIEGFKSVLVEDHNSLSFDPDGNVGFAFIHGNWALDNSHPEGMHCGINDELKILNELGCYVDMTLPSAPGPTQTSTINSIYMAHDDLEKPKSHDKGDIVKVGKELDGDLMIVQGPLSLDWKNRKKKILPTIENSDIRDSFPPSEDRVDLWVDQKIHVKGRPEWVFIKIHTHGTQDDSIDTLLGEPVDKMFSYLEAKYNDGESYVLHYVNAREVYNIIKAARDGKSGNPNDYRDYWYKMRAGSK